MPDPTQNPPHLKLRTLDVLVQEHSRLRALLDNMPDSVFFKDTTGHYLDFNTRFTDLLGLSRYEVIGQTDQTIFPDRADIYANLDSQVIQTEAPVLIRDNITSPSGEHIDLEVTRAPVFDEAGYLLGILGIGRDITRQRTMEESLRLSAQVFEYSHDGILITDAQSHIVDVNAAFETLTGYTRAEVLGKTPSILKSDRHDPQFYEDLWASVKNQGYWKGEIWNRRKNGVVFPENINIIAVTNPAGEITNYLATFSDITELKASEERLRHMAHHDALTQLPNRTLLADRIEQALAQASRRSTLLAVCYLDLDGFKPVNDTYGHATGDRLLVEISRRLTDCLRAGDTIARLGGDEFALLLTDLESAEQTEILLKRVLTVIGAPFHVVDTIMATVTASIGYTLFPYDNVDADALLRHADHAMYQAKLAGRNQIHQFDLIQDKLHRSHHETQGRITEALINNELVLYFQPLVNMRLGQVIGAEALIRWHHPERGLLLPGEFLPQLEDSDAIVKIGRWVLKTALAYLQKWHQQGLSLQVGINVAARHIMEPGFADELKGLLKAYPDINPIQLELEILETTALEDMSQVSAVMNECRELGVKFALDDFGTGYSSLTYFKRLSADTLKIDQSFVRDILDDPEDLAIVEGILGLTTAFKRHAIAEGVETVEHGILLLHLGCDFAQGYGIARPMPADDFPTWVRTFVPDPSWITSTTLRWRRENFPLVAVEVDHRRWVDDIEEAVLGNIPLSRLQLEHLYDTTACRFGAWYSGPGETQFAKLAEFQDIRPLHDKLHQIAGDIGRALLANDTDKAYVLLKQMREAQRALLEALSTLQIVVAMGMP